MALTMITLTGTFTDPLTGDPAVGTVTITSPWELSDPDTPASYPPINTVVTLDVNGHFEISLPATNCDNITPAGWAYTVIIDTDLFCDTKLIQLDCDTPGGEVDISELANATSDDDLVTYATLIALNAEETARVAADAALQAEIDAISGGAVFSVNGQTGVVVLDATDVSAASEAALAAEVAARIAADTALQADIDAITTATNTVAGIATLVQPATPATITFGATLNTNAALGVLFRTTLAGDALLANPTNLIDGARLTWELIQDGAGNHALTLDTIFSLGTDIPTITLSTGAGLRDFLGGIYNASTNKIYLVSFIKGFS